MSFYVERINRDRGDTESSWTGPIRSRNQALREVEAWRSAGWVANYRPSSPEINRKVRDWQKRMDARHGRDRSGRIAGR